MEGNTVNKDLRWRIITLQIVMVIVLGFGAGLSFWGSNFTNEQIKGQLEPQKIFFPKDISTVPEPEKSALQPFVGQQVLNGEQAHIFAQNYLGLHLRELADGKVYSELSTEARTEKDPALKAQKDALVQTAFRGETLRSMLNQAWAFSIFGSVALYAAFGLLLATLVVAGALAFELFYAPRRASQPVRASTMATSAS
jgi:hypothetical protein